MNSDSNNELESFYKQTIEALREAPPSFVWDQIETKLDVRDVWLRIETKLEAQKIEQRSVQLRRVSRWVAAAVILVMVSLAQPIGRQSVQIKHTPRMATAAIVEPQSRRERLVAAEASGAANSGGKVSQPLLSAEKWAAAYTQVKRRKIQNNNQLALVETMDLGHEQQTLSQQEERNLFAHTWSRGMEYLAPISECILGDAYYDQLPFRKRVRIGIIGSISNNWMLTRTQVLSTNQTSFALNSLGGAGRNFGVITTLDLDRNLSLQAEVMRVETNQRVSETYGNRFTPMRLNMRYLTASFLGVYRHNHSLEGYNASFHVVGGLSFARLMDAQKETSDSKINVADNYTKRLAGLSFGLEYEVEPLENWSATLGVRSNYALNSIEKEATDVAEIRRVDTFMWGMYLTVKYTIY
jgi:hypothetical protein